MHNNVKLSNHGAQFNARERFHDTERHFDGK